MKKLYKPLLQTGILLSTLIAISFASGEQAQANTSSISLGAGESVVTGNTINVHSGRASVSGTGTGGLSVTASVHKNLVLAPNVQVFSTSVGPGQGFGQTISLDRSSYYPQLRAARPGGGTGTMTLREL